MVGVGESISCTMSEKIGRAMSGRSLYAWSGMPLGPGEEDGRFFQTVAMWSGEWSSQAP